MSKVLVTGGAGYIGSHTVLALNLAGYEVVVYDNLSTGFAQAVLSPARLEIGELDDLARLEALMQTEKFDSIIHFAASIVVPESVEQPLPYYFNNSINTASLVRLSIKHNVQNFIFSSTAAVYGMPEKIPVSEQEPTEPINPYGRSKLISEWILEDTARAHDMFSYIALRYFNVAGADPELRLGQSTPKATHLIKTACRTALNLQDILYIYGADYPTFDGTGIRDYIHVTDLAEAHLLSLRHLEQGGPSKTFNCGYGHGYSVKQIIKAVKKASQRDFPTKITERRPGDAAELVAFAEKIKRELNFQPKYNDIDFIVQTAYDWEKNRPY